MKAHIDKDERIEIRVSAQDKKLFRRAQMLSGDKTFSSFIIRIIRMEAESIISEADRILVSEKDREMFFNAVFADMEPNADLRTAAEKYKSKI